VGRKTLTQSIDQFAIAAEAVFSQLHDKELDGLTCCSAFTVLIG